MQNITGAFNGTGFVLRARRAIRVDGYTAPTVHKADTKPNRFAVKPHSRIAVWSFHLRAVE
jgi:hypothetical protein